MKEILQACTLFLDWPASEIDHLSKLAQERHLNIGQLLFTEGEIAKSLFVVKSGQLKIEKSSGDDDQVVAQFGRGSYFGEMGMLSLEGVTTRSAGATALEASQVIELSYEDLITFLETHPILGLKFYRALAISLSTRIRKTTQDLAGIKALRLRHV